MTEQNVPLSEAEINQALADLEEKPETKPEPEQNVDVTEKETDEAVSDLDVKTDPEVVVVPHVPEEEISYEPSHEEVEELLKRHGLKTNSKVVLEGYDEPGKQN